MVVVVLIANADPHAVVILVWVGTKIVYEKFGLLRQLEAELLHCLGLGLGLRLRSRLGLRLRLRLGLQYGQGHLQGFRVCDVRFCAFIVLM